MPLTVALYGDSYIFRLKNFCKSDLRIPADVSWFDKSGLRSDFVNKKGKIDETAKANFESLKKERPDAVFINVGGNDLTTTSNPREVYDRIICLADELQQAGVKVVCVAEIMTRGDFSKCPDPEMNKRSFDLQRKRINTLLAKKFKDKFLKFADIDLDNPTDYDKDPCPFVGLLRDYQQYWLEEVREQNSQSSMQY